MKKTQKNTATLYRNMDTTAHCVYKLTRTKGQPTKSELIAEFHGDNMEKNAERFADMMNLSPSYPNGMDSWIETHYEMVAAIEHLRAQEYDQPDLIREINDTQGTPGFWELARDWTDEFEQRNEGKLWDGEFFEMIEMFVQAKINGKYEKHYAAPVRALSGGGYEELPWPLPADIDPAEISQWTVYRREDDSPMVQAIADFYGETAMKDARAYAYQLNKQQ